MGSVRFRLVTFNIAHGRGLTPLQGLTPRRRLQMNLVKIAALLHKLKPDVVALQEIDQCSCWAGNFDELEYLRRHARFPHAVFGINTRREGVFNLCYGNALLSRHPIVRSENVVFGQKSVGEKGFLFAELNVGGRTIPVVNLHLHYRSRNLRLKQLDRLVPWLHQHHRAHGVRWRMPPLVCGDFNTPSHAGDATAVLLRHMHDFANYAMHPQVDGTFPSPWPQRTLDFVFLPPACDHVHCEVVDTMLSDHRPVMVDFTLH